MNSSGGSTFADPSPASAEAVSGADSRVAEAMVGDGVATSTYFVGGVIGAVSGAAEALVDDGVSALPGTAVALFDGWGSDTPPQATANSVIMAKENNSNICLFIIRTS